MRHPLSRHGRPFAVGLAFLLSASAVPIAAHMNTGTQDDMEGMGAAPVQPKRAPMASPARPAPAASMQGMAAPAKPAPDNAMPMPTGVPQGPAQPAMAAAMPSGPATQAMAEPKPSSLNGGMILGLFAVLNAGIIAVAAALKPRRKPMNASSEVKA